MSKNLNPPHPPLAAAEVVGPPVADFAAANERSADALKLLKRLRQQCTLAIALIEAGLGKEVDDDDPGLGQGEMLLGDFKITPRFPPPAPPVEEPHKFTPW